MEEDIMFTIFFTEAMDPFYEICSSFPTVVFTIILFFFILYWVLAVLGLVDIEILDFDVPESLDVADMGDVGNDLNNLHVLAGLMLKLGLNGVPVTIILSSISLFGWMISFTLVYFINPWVPTTLLQFLVGVPIFIASLYVSTMFTAALIRPLRPLFLATNQETQKVILGKLAIVRTGRVDQSFGEANVDDGGAGLIVKIRSYNNESFKRGDRVILLEYVAPENIYKVVSEKDFKGN